ncbi:MAG TPA: hypothetical protein VGM56_30790 [Byssovorax sp.]|jgi:hypothetical protein
MQRLLCAAFGAVIATSTGCATAKKVVEAAKAPPPPPSPVPERFHNKCDAAKGQNRPLVVEWDAADRAALEAQARAGQLVVHYAGCDLEVLRRCKAPKRQVYGYTGITQKEERVSMKSADELYASVPVHAATLEAKLKESGELRAEMTIVGEYGVAGVPPAVDQLEGECAGATHVVTALTVGAFSFVAASAREAAASATVMGFGASGSAKGKSESLSRDGDVAACAASKRGDATPPEGCGALLRVELAPLLAAGEGTPECKPGTHLVGKQCKPVDKPSKLAQEDKTFVDEEAGKGWGVRCFVHLRAGAIPFARAACQKGLEQHPDDATKGMILFNYALVERATGDPVAACGYLAQSLTVRTNKDVQAMTESMHCADLMRSM